MFSAHTSRPVTTTTPTRVAGHWAHIRKPLHLEIQLPSSVQTCGENCANSTRLNSSVCSTALACRVFSKCFQTSKIYRNYLTCENKLVHEKRPFSFRGSLRVKAWLSKGEFGLWLLAVDSAKEWRETSNSFYAGSTAKVSSWAQFNGWMTW